MGRVVITPLYCINGNLNSQRETSVILRPLAMPFLHQNGPQAIFQNDNSKPNFTIFCYFIFSKVNGNGEYVKEITSPHPE